MRRTWELLMTDDQDIHNRFRELELKNRELELLQEIDRRRSRRHWVTLIGILVWVFIAVPACGAMMQMMD
jgi:hypothetical protein